MAHHQLLRDLQLFKLWAGLSTLCFAGIAGAAFRQAQPPRNLGEIRVERINVATRTARCGW